METLPIQEKNYQMVKFAIRFFIKEKNGSGNFHSNQKVQKISEKGIYLFYQFFIPYCICGNFNLPSFPLKNQRIAKFCPMVMPFLAIECKKTFRSKNRKKPKKINFNFSENKNFKRESVDSDHFKHVYFSI